MNYAAPKRRIDLDTLDMVWRVVKGEASVMVEPAPGSDLPRTSRTLMRVREGGYVFGFSSEGQEQLKVFVETTPGAQLVPMLTEDFITACRSNPEQGEKLLSNAIRQVSRHVSPDIPPATVRKMLRPGKNFRLPKSTQVSAVSELWLRIENGSCSYGGAEAGGSMDEDLFRPLTGNMWLNMETSGRLVCVSTQDLLLKGRFFQAFSAFASLAINMTLESFSDLALTKFRRLVESSKHRTDEFGRALHLAASIVEPEYAGTAAAQGLVAAITEVCSGFGCRVMPPPKTPDNPDKHLEDILNHNSLYTREVVLSGKWWEDDAGPLLGFVHQEEGISETETPVALMPGRKGYTMPDPKTGQRVLVDEASSQTIRPMALQIYPPFPAGSPGPLALTAHSMKGCGPELVQVGMMGLLGGLAGFGIPLGMSTTVDKVITNGEYSLLGQIIFGLIMVVFGNAVFEFAKNRALLRTETRAQISLQSSIFGKLLKLPLDFYKGFPAGDLSNRVMAVDGIRASLSGAVIISILSAAFSMTNIVLLAVYSWQLALAVTGLLLVTLLGTWLLMKHQMKFQATVQNVIGKLAGMELQLVTGINKLRAAGAEVHAFARWMDHFAELRKITLSIGKATNVVTVYSSSLPLFTSMMVFGMFSLTAMHQELSLGSFLCFNSALGQLTAAVASLCSMSLSLIFIKPMYMRAKPIIDAKPETHPALEDPGQLSGAVETVGVSFAYKGAQRPALQGVSFQANPGEFVAIVGPSGSGKSTLLKLILGFYPPAAGSVLFDGKPMRRLDPVKIRKQVGTVIQNGELIQGNLFFNIMGASAEATEEDAWEAARLAAVDEDIRRMPMGMHTFVPHGGGTFSGGQKQRIMLARALSKRPKIFLLDEATSNLDNTTQAQVMTNLQHINATRIVVAHRLSTVVDADRIYVMDQGRVIESGTYQQLMDKNGLFTKLASRQIQ